MNAKTFYLYQLNFQHFPVTVFVECVFVFAFLIVFVFAPFHGSRRISFHRSLGRPAVAIQTKPLLLALNSCRNAEII